MTEETGKDMKKEILTHLEEKGYQVIDIGTNSPESCDYLFLANGQERWWHLGKRIWGF